MNRIYSFHLKYKIYKIKVINSILGKFIGQVIGSRTRTSGFKIKEVTGGPADGLSQTRPHDTGYVSPISLFLSQSVILSNRGYPI